MYIQGVVQQQVQICNIQNFYFTKNTSLFFCMLYNCLQVFVFIHMCSVLHMNINQLFLLFTYYGQSTCIQKVFCLCVRTKMAFGFVTKIKNKVYLQKIQLQYCGCPYFSYEFTKQFHSFQGHLQFAKNYEVILSHLTRTILTKDLYNLTTYIFKDKDSKKIFKAVLMYEIIWFTCDNFLFFVYEKWMAYGNLLLLVFSFLFFYIHQMGKKIILFFIFSFQYVLRTFANHCICAHIYVFYWLLFCYIFLFLVD
eukprot:TRINITY_DN3076_c1_g2_i6.p2 TRINITY_DN3076_c1_g2~~TRINITY_DN3076_c1_g2_i6.p2  ORF type:complete len:252 (-),score=-14.81 TRINITY_DN3076_c1_g2_i6:168-923(-)